MPSLHPLSAPADTAPSIRTTMSSRRLAIALRRRLSVRSAQLSPQRPPRAIRRWTEPWLSSWRATEQTPSLRLSKPDTGSSATTSRDRTTASRRRRVSEMECSHITGRASNAELASSRSSNEWAAEGETRRQRMKARIGQSLSTLSLLHSRRQDSALG
jgi:hypothetical protein